MLCQILFSGKIKRKKITNMLSAELAKRPEKVKLPLRYQMNLSEVDESKSSYFQETKVKGDWIPFIY